MDEAQPHKQERATAIVTHVVEPGREAEFEAWQRGIMQAASIFIGHHGTEVIRTAHGPKPEYVIIMHYDTQENLQTWENSTERADWLARGKH